MFVAASPIICIKPVLDSCEVVRLDVVPVSGLFPKQTLRNLLAFAKTQLARGSDSTATKAHNSNPCEEVCDAMNVAAETVSDRSL